MAANDTNAIQELNSVKYGSFADITRKIQEVSVKYNNMPMENLIAAFGRSGIGDGLSGFAYTNNPYVQNRRVKTISSSPALYKKGEVEQMLRNVENNETPLRQVHHALEYTSYPLLHTRAVYQNLLTYHNYIAPYLVDDAETKKNDFWREWKLLEKLRTEFQIKSITHEIVGQTLQEGKVFYYPRFSVDKAHNKVNHAFMQQLPSDHTKIVGYNNKSKYTLAFNLMYFTQEGTDIRQFGDLFAPYMDNFNRVVYPAPKGVGTKLVYASKTDLKLSEINDSGVDAYYQNGQWFYWVTLPIDEVFTFEIDDVPRTVVSPFTGLIVDMLQLSQLENLQMELLSNPLIAVLTGEIPYFDKTETNIADQYKLSNAGRMLFEALWDQLMQRTNIGGIGLYAAPFRNMQLETLPEAPNATNIVSSGYRDVMNKAGLSAIMPVSDDVRAGLAQISLKIEAQFAKTVYDCMERMMNVIIERLNLKYDFRFHIFGDIASDDEIRETVRKDMTLGLLPAVLIYDALADRSIMEDISWSDAIVNSGVLEKRLPLISSYNASASDSGLPPKSNNPIEDEGGRPRSEDATTDGGEQDEDSYGDSRFVRWE